MFLGFRGEWLSRLCRKSWTLGSVVSCRLLIPGLLLLLSGVCLLLWLKAFCRLGPAGALSGLGFLGLRGEGRPSKAPPALAGH